MLAATHPWCHPDCLSQERPLFLWLYAAREPTACPTYVAVSGVVRGKNLKFFPLTTPDTATFSSVSRSRRRSESASPFRTFTLFRIAVGRCPHTLFAQRGSDVIALSSLRITAKCLNVKCFLGNLFCFL